MREFCENYSKFDIPITKLQFSYMFTLISIAIIYFTLNIQTPEIQNKPIFTPTQTVFKVG